MKKNNLVVVDGDIIGSLADGVSRMLDELYTVEDKISTMEAELKLIQPSVKVYQKLKDIIYPGVIENGKTSYVWRNSQEDRQELTDRIADLEYNIGQYSERKEQLGIELTEFMKVLSKYGIDDILDLLDISDEVINDD